MANRARMIDNILQQLRNINPEFVAGVDKAQQFGEGFVSRSKNFNDGPYARPAAFEFAEADAGSHDYLGYRGAFKGRTPILDDQGNQMLDRAGRPLFDKGNRLYDKDGNTVGFYNYGDRIQTPVDAEGTPLRPIREQSGTADPTGGSFGAGYAVGRVMADFGNNASLNQWWRFNHPLGVASTIGQRVNRVSGEAKGNRAMTTLAYLAPSVALGAAAGNVELSSLMEGDITGRARGSQAVERKRNPDGTLDKSTETESANAIAEVAQRYILGRSGKIITDYDAYVNDKLEGGEIPVDEYTFKQSKAKQFEKKTLGNLFGIMKFEPTNAINNEASYTQLGYTVPLSAATTFGGSMVGAGAMGTLMRQGNVPMLNAYPRGGRGRGAVSALLTGAGMLAGGLAGKGVGVAANDALQQQLNPRNAEFQANIKQELERRKRMGDQYPA